MSRLAEPHIAVPKNLFKLLFWTVLACLTLTLASRVAIPMYPVPITLQTFAVLLVGGFLGRRLGVFVVGLWLCLAMAGLPLLADGRGGLETFLGPTGGYLAAFVPMAWMTAHFTSQREGSFFLLDLITCVVAHALCLGLGVLWLSRFIPFEDAFTEGALPFLLGALIKSAAAALAFSVVRWRFQLKSE